MRLLRSLLLLCVAFAACELPRPEGAYFPSDAEDEPTTIDAGRIDAGLVLPGMPSGGTVSMGGTQAGMPGGQDAGAPGGPGGMDAGEPQLTPEQMALKKLEGRYLMRMDMFSSASATQGLITVSTRNRVSHLLVTQLSLVDGQLRSNERICYQTYEHVCAEGCQSLRTLMKAPMVDIFRSKPLTSRMYTVSSGQLKGLSNTMPLGYDPDASNALPVTRNESVWDVPSNTGREGLWLELHLVAIRRIDCDVYTVQKFVSDFDGKLAGSSEEPTLTGVKFRLNTDASDGRTLDASNADCKDDGSGAPPTRGEEWVQFARVPDSQSDQDFWGCTAAQSAWDKLITRAP